MMGSVDDDSSNSDLIARRQSACCSTHDRTVSAAACRFCKTCDATSLCGITGGFADLPWGRPRNNHPTAPPANAANTGAPNCNKAKEDIGLHRGQVGLEGSEKRNSGLRQGAAEESAKP